MALITLAAGTIEVDVMPELGGGVARFDWRSPTGEMVPVFRRATASPDPLDLGMIVLAPWSNRMSGGGFSASGAFYPVPRNLARSKLPVHGNAFQSPWAVTGRTPTRLELELNSEGPGPYAYRARLAYEVDESALAVSIEITNRSEATLPYGFGLHPWLTRTPAMTLRAPARRAWFFDAHGLPSHACEPRDCPGLDFAEARQVPQGSVAAWFTGWSGAADVAWPERGLALSITASPELPIYILYAPDAQATFLCFEPVSHGVDAHNTRYDADEGPLSLLRIGESMEAAVRFALSPLDALAGR